MSNTFNPKVSIKVVITDPPGASCRRLIYNAGVVADRLGLELKIARAIGTDEGKYEQLTPPFFIFDELVVGKDIAVDKLEQIIRERLDSIK